MPKTCINGVELSHWTIGHGHEDLVLIHGLAANMAFWHQKVLKTLSRRYRVTLFDLRGHGYSGMPPSGYTATAMAADLVGLLDHLRITDAHLVGHSYGGTLALHAALDRPDLVRSISLLDTRLRAIQPRQRLVDWPNWREVKKQFEDLELHVDEHEENLGLVLLEKVASPEWKHIREALAKKALFIPFGGWSGGDRVASRWLKLLRETTARADFNGCDGLPFEHLERVRQPILGIYGERSRCLGTCEAVRRLWPDCTLRVVPEAGHFFPATVPGFVARTIDEFATSTPVAEPPLDRKPPLGAVEPIRRKATG